MRHVLNHLKGNDTIYQAIQRPCTSLLMYQQVLNVECFFSCRKDFLIYERVGQPPVHGTCNYFDEKVNTYLKLSYNVNLNEAVCVILFLVYTNLL